MARQTADDWRPRFWEKIEVGRPNDCWEWAGSVNNSGYGNFGIRSGVYPVHRIMYELFIAPILGWDVIDHLCNNRTCVNPAHLQAVSSSVNNERRKPFTRDKCKRGHPFTDDSVYIKSDGTRTCHQCKLETMRRWYNEHKASK